MKTSILKARIKRKMENPSFTLAEGSEILDFTNANLKDLQGSEEPLILFKPTDNQWVLLTTKRIAYNSLGKLKQVDLKDIINRYFFERRLQDINFGGVTLTCDQIHIKTPTEELRLWIETGAVYSFDTAIGILSGAKGGITV